MKTVWTKEQIDKIFEYCEEQGDTQGDVLLALYMAVVPNWENVIHINGFPTAGKEVREYIARKFIKFDRKYHPNIIPGGLWLDKGFGADDSLKGFEVAIDLGIVEYKNEEKEAK